MDRIPYPGKERFMANNTAGPNILFIMADQFRGDVMSCVGGPAKTPNLDALAAEGVCFTNCCTVAPLCVPARISMMTGKYPHTTGVWDNAGTHFSDNGLLAFYAAIPV